MDAKVQSIVRQLQRQLATHYGERLSDLVLYGSQARGDAVEGSDIDVLVVLRGAVHAPKEIDETLGIVARLSLANEAVISCAFTSADDFERKSNLFLRNVRQEGIPF
ncbi:MAG: nucleotidyltransferase domain-containing protein [Bdellovibrionota bacterium]